MDLPRDFFWTALKALFFRCDAERVHDWTHALLRWLGRGGLRRRFASLASSSRNDRSLPRPPSVLIAGLAFANRVGLAAGFDKNAELLPVLPHLGFGFAEIGTVTPRPQAGNPLPRLFREPERRALFNRMGFNGQGAAAAARNLAEARLSGILPANFPIGVNVGKNKDTPAEDAAADYARAAAAFEGLADYLVVNVSSPNTPGLRELQNAEDLRKIIDAVRSTIATWKKMPPLFLKLAPELGEESLRALIPALESAGAQGWVLTNTLGGEWKDGIRGGFSGAPLKELSFSRLKIARAIARTPIISVGGIDGESEALRRIDAGADLVQIYSGWIFGGPALPSRIAAALSKHPSLRSR